jgi:hypothetical protein
MFLHFLTTFYPLWLTDIYINYCHRHSIGGIVELSVGYILITNLMH